jgi:sarcosine oxidase subunit alpha
MKSFEFEGRRIEFEGEDSVASALYRAGVRIFSRSFKYHRPRGLYCLSGDCPNCLMTVDREPGVRTCMTPARDRMKVSREKGWPSATRDIASLLWHARGVLSVGFYYRWMVHPRVWKAAEPWIRKLAGLGTIDEGLAPVHRETCHHHPQVLVIGGGLAGLSAALAAAQSGASVALVDEGVIGHQVARGTLRDQILSRVAELRARREVTVLERATAIGIYEGPLAPVIAPDLLHLFHPQRIVVATGAVEHHPVFSGSDLPGVFLGRAAARLAGIHGVPPAASVVFAGASQESVEHVLTLRRSSVRVLAALVPQRLAGLLPPDVPAIAPGAIVGARGRGRVKAAVIEAPSGRRVLPCDAIVLSLGLSPRSSLLRQGNGFAVSGAGDVIAPGCSLEEAIESGCQAGLGNTPLASEAPLPACGTTGFICPCEDVTVSDFERAWQEGFQSTELLKRYTTVTMGPCQGALCHPHLRAFVKARSGAPALSAPTTARPPARPVRLEDVAAGQHAVVEQRTALHQRHLAMGAHMEWAGAWKRPQTYGNPTKEYWCVRSGVSVMDVGTLGKFMVGGRDGLQFLERLYPCHVHDIREGGIRYALLLNEAGYLIDDGIICPTGPGRYYLTVTSSGADQAESWFQDWADTWKLKVHVVNQTPQFGAINVAGPQARALLARLSPNDLDPVSFPYGRSKEIEVAGISCRAFRVGFVGELSFELHHPSSQSVPLWDALLSEGASLGIGPHGLEALRLLRLEKGHILIGQDTDFDTTPAKIALDWAVKMDKPDFVGRAALQRIATGSIDQKLLSIAFQGAQAPAEGASVHSNGACVGYLTSSRFSPALGHGVALGWIRTQNGSFPQTVAADGVPGAVIAGAFYDPTGGRLRA